CADARTRTRCVATAAALRATRRHQMISRRSLLLALGIGLAVRLVNIYGMSRFPMAEYQFRAPEADMSLAYEWSGHIVRGDLHGLFLLRDTLGVTVSLLMLWALARCRDVEPRRWLLAGLLLAVATLCREATLLFAPLIAVWVLRRFHADGRALRRAVLWFLVGLGLGLAPLVGRNIAVGAPPLALSQSGIQVFIHGNAPGAAGFGWRVPPDT